MQIKYVLALVAGILLFYSCRGGQSGEVDKSKHPLVTVLDKTLYLSDLEGVTYYGMSVEDSTAATQSYIKTWINDVLLFDKARKNISNKTEVDILVEAYRKSLIINDYQTRLLRERLSKEITDAELKEFHQSNKELFNLRENIIRGLYLKIPRESSQIDNFIKWYKQDNEAAIKNIEDNSLQNVVGYEYFYDQWIGFNDIITNIPEMVKNSEEYLKQNKTIEVRDSSFLYLLYVKEYKLIGSEAPFEFIREYLRDSYIQEKREKFIKELEADLYNEALSDGKLIHYVK